MPDFIGNWEFWIGLEDTDPIDDTLSFQLLNVGKTSSGQTGQQVLALRHYPDHLQIGISWDTFISQNTTATVITRFGKNQAREARWYLSSERTVTFLPENEQADFLKNLLQVSSLTARLTTAEGNTITVTFDVFGLSKAFDDLRERGVVFV